MGAEAINAIAECREVGGQHNPAMASAQGGQRTHPLDRHLSAGLLVDGVDVGGRRAFQLELDLGAHGPWQRVHDHVRYGARLGRDPDAAAHGLYGEVEGVGRYGAGIPELVAGVLIGRGDRRPGQDVVELVEQYELPGLGQLGPRVGGAAQTRRYGAPALGREQQVLGPAVPTLDPRVGRIATDGVVLKVADVGREVGPARHGVEVATRAR